MKNLHAHFNSISESDLNPYKTFTPIRRLILLDDKNWGLFLEDKSPENLGAIENLIAMNEIFPTGVPNFRHELGKFLAELDTLQVTLSVLDSLSIDGRVSNIIEDFRMSTQNFVFFMSIKSYYSSFQELRKMLEGILWINHLTTSNEVLPDTITTDKYGKLLEQINPKYSNLYKKLNKLFHYSSKKTPYFNINRVYSPKDWLMELLKDTTDLADDFINDANSLLKKINHPQIQRYFSILDILFEARQSYNLENWKISKTPNIVLPSEDQELFSKLLLDDSKPKNKISLMSNQYEEGIKKLLNSGVINDEPKIIHPLTYTYLSKFDSNFLEYNETLSQEIMDLSNQSINIQRNKRIQYCLQVNKRVFKKCIKVMKKLFVYEIQQGGDKNIAFFKSILEDVILNNSIHKGINFMLLFLIQDVLKITYGIETPSLKEYVKYKHLIIQHRQMYGGVENRNTGKENLFSEYMKTLDVFLDFIMKIYQR